MSHRFFLFSVVLILAGVTLSACDSGPSAKDPDPFHMPTMYDVGKKPSMVITHDMNNDDFPDILVSNSQDNNIMFFEGRGDGTFKDPFTMDTGREPMALAAADFNGDGIADIAVCNYGDGNIQIFLGQKDGVFKNAGTVKAGKLPINIATGDFNNDRKTDLAVSLRFDKLIIFLGNGDGTFKLAEAYKAHSLPVRVVVGDYDNDGNQDLAVAFNGVKADYIRIFFGNGNGTFLPPKTIRGGHQAMYIEQADMNKDGHMDLIVSSPTTDSLTLFIGDGKGGFRPTEEFAAEKGPRHIIPGEFSGDSVPDLLILNERDNSVSLLQGRGDGTFIYPHFNYPVGRHPWAIAGSDFNKDGMKDVAIILYDNAVLEILMRKIPARNIQS